MDLDALIAHLALDSGRLALAIVMAQSKLAIALGPQRSQNCDRIGAPIRWPDWTGSLAVRVTAASLEIGEQEVRSQF